MSNLLKTFLCGAAVLAANPAFAQLSLQGGGSSIVSTTGPAASSLGITTTVPGIFEGSLDVGVSANTPHPGTTTTSATTGTDASGGENVVINTTNKALALKKGPAAASVGVSTLIARQGSIPIAVDVVVGVARTTPYGSSAFTYAIGGGAPGSTTKITK
jgi:hypothetical protein